MEITFVHRRKTVNQGDLNCSPGSYFSFGEKNNRFVELRSNKLSGETVVLGGGGLFHPSMVADVSRLIANNRVIVWGAGSPVVHRALTQ